MKKIITILATTACISLSFGCYAQTDNETFCNENLSVYQMRYKNESKSKEFSPETINAWRNVFLNCPGKTKNMYVPHGTTIYTTLYKKESDATKKKQYLDTIMMIYDQRIQYLGEESKFIGKKGADLFILDPTQYNQAYEYCKKSIDAMGNNSEPKTLVICMQTAVKKFQNNAIEKTEVIALYQQIRAIFDFNIDRYKDDEGKKQPYADQIPNIEQFFLSIKPDCNDLVALFEPQFNANPSDPELLKKITDNLGSDCANTDLYFKVAIELDKIEPSAQSKRAIGDMYIAKKQITKGLEYYKQAITMELDADKKANLYYKLAYNTNGSTSVSYAKSALSLNPRLGSAYLIIASKYIDAIGSCTEGTEFPELEKWKIYWVAYDMCEKAIAADPSIKSQANGYISNYKSHFPDAEALFGYNITDGQTQNVGCWINTSTTARVK